MSDLTSNLEKLTGYLERFKSTGVLHHINGKNLWSKSGDTFQSVSPVDESFICDVAKGGAEEIALAADAAKNAFPEWRDLTGIERKKILHKIADGIVARAEEIALCESWDTGQPIRFMAKAAIRGAENFRFFADRAPAARDGQSLPSPTLMNVTTRVPIGPVGVITPWNTPFMLSTWKIAPALAAGCTVVHKPAELSPVTASILMEIAKEAGLPDGVWNLVNGIGEEAGKALCEHSDIKAIAFVGESRTGSQIMKQGADTLKRVHFELGGKNPVVVFDDADLDRALDAAIFMIYSLNGERCTSSSRLLVQDTIADTFEAKLIERVNAIKVGHPLDPATEVGPLIHTAHFNKVSSYFDIAKTDGATIAAGGARDGDIGFFVKPTLFTHATNDMRIAQEEIFGPVLTSIRFTDEDQALQMANDVNYGLTGYIWTNDLTRALRFSDKLEAGMIWVNSENVRHLPTPFGGVKASGIGRDGGDWSFEFYMEQKHIGFCHWIAHYPKTRKTVMPVPAPNLNPDFNVVRLSHVEYNVRDLAASRAFYVDTLGLQITHETEDAIYLRAMEERGHHCIHLIKSDTASVGVLGFKVWEDADLDRLSDFFTERGLPVEWIEKPFFGRILRSRDPWGIPLEFYAKMERLAPIHQKYALYRGVKPLRIDHFNMFSSDVDASVNFYNDMGFRVTEYTEDSETGRLWAAWMHRKGGVHDIAFTNGIGPRLHHSAFWVPTPLNIIDLLDLMSTTGYVANIERGPGRHGISNAFFLYVRDPDGHRIEIYCSDYQTVDPDLEPIKWDLTDPQRQTLWGAAAPKSWFEEGSLFDGATPVDPVLKAQPIIAP